MNNLIKNIVILNIFFAVLLGFGNSANAQKRNEILIVADQTTSCRGTVAQDCLQVKHLDEKEFRILRGEIANFKYVSGYFYVLEVRENPRNGNYRLQKILARVKSENNPGDAAKFFGTRWNLIKIEGKNTGATKAFIEFDEQKPSVGGNGDCNGFGGNMTKNGNRIKFLRIISTKMYCDGNSDIEGRFFTALDRVNEYEIKGERLFLMSDKTVVLEFEAE